jgi:hypothetical protein
MSSLQNVVRLNGRGGTPFPASISFDFKKAKTRRIGATLA